MKITILQQNVGAFAGSGRVWFRLVGREISKRGNKHHSYRGY